MSPNLIIIIIALKGAIQDLLQSPHCTANCLQHVRSRGMSATVCISHAAHRALIKCNTHTCVPCGTKGQLSYSLNHIYFSFVLLAEPLTDEGICHNPLLPIAQDTDRDHDMLLLVARLTSQEHASASQRQTCSDYCTRCHTEIEVTAQTCYLTQSQ